MLAASSAQASSAPNQHLLATQDSVRGVEAGLIAAQDSVALTRSATASSKANPTLMATQVGCRCPHLQSVHMRPIPWIGAWPNTRAKMLAAKRQPNFSNLTPKPPTGFCHARQSCERTHQFA